MVYFETTVCCAASCSEIVGFFDQLTDRLCLLIFNWGSTITPLPSPSSRMISTWAILRNRKSNRCATWCRLHILPGKAMLNSFIAVSFDAPYNTLTLLGSLITMRLLLFVFVVLSVWYCAKKATIRLFYIITWKKGPQKFSHHNFRRLTNHQFWENITTNWKNTKQSAIFWHLPILSFWLNGISNFNNIRVAQTYSDLSKVSQRCGEKLCSNQNLWLSWIVFFWDTM